MSNNYEEKVKSEGSATAITNVDLICKDCIFKLKDTSKRCKKFEPYKPTRTILGGGCDEYIKE